MDRENRDEAKLMWRPPKSRRVSMADFREIINTKFRLQLTNYHQLYKWSCENYSAFWEEYYKYSGIIASSPFDLVVEANASIAQVPKWFRGARLNYAENLLRFHDDRVALYGVIEGRLSTPRPFTFRETRRQVAQYAAALRRMGVVKGDTVAGYIPNCPEALFATLATASIGAIWSSTSPDFGVDGVVSRFSQIKPKILFTVNSVVYNGKVHDHVGKVREVVKALPSLRYTVVISFGDDRQFDPPLDAAGSLSLIDFLSFAGEPGSGYDDGHSDNGVVEPVLVFEQVPFDHPLFIMYTSGTTGHPKCMVHSVGGTLIQHLKEHQLHGNTGENDVLFYYTTTGWMMWNWMITAMSLGCCLVLYDGSPRSPSPSVLFDLVDKLGVTILGTSAKWISHIEETGQTPCTTHRLTSLHTILSTGSPLRPSSYDFVYKKVKADLLLGSISGGTDIISCFMGQNVELPVVRGEIQSANLGMAIQIYNELGKAVEGERGELICSKPFPSMPTLFWDDENGEKYKKAYFSSFPGVWAHGDFCVMNPVTRGFVMLGRSDGTLNPNGVRFGSAEIYSVVERLDGIDDSVCVAQRNKEGDERIILFLKLKVGTQFDKDLVSKVKSRIRSSLSSRHVPAVVLSTPDIPYTISGKKVEIAVKRIIAGENVKDRGAYSNPDSLDFYRDIKELQEW